MAPTKILLVEDDEAFRYVATRHLSGAGFDVVAAATTMEALEKVTAHAPDCLVTDIQMPSGIPHGLSLANILRSRNPRLAVVFMTAYENVSEIVSDAWGPGSVVLSKPLDLDELVQAIQSRVEASAARPR